MDIIALGVFWSDSLRFLSIGQAFILFVFGVVIVARYTFKLSILRAKENALPWHIVLIGVSYLSLVAFAMLEIRDHFGSELTWRTPTTIVIFALGNVALIFMSLHLSVQRLVVAALVDRMATQLQSDLQQLKVATSIAAEKADVAAKKAQVAAETVQQTHKAVSEIKHIIDGHGH